MRRWNHDRRFDGTPKIKLQAFEPSSPESLQSQTSLRSKNRLPLNDLGGSSRSTTAHALAKQLVSILTPAERARQGPDLLDPPDHLRLAARRAALPRHLL